MSSPNTSCDNFSRDKESGGSVYRSHVNNKHGESLNSAPKVYINRHEQQKSDMTNRIRQQKTNISDSDISPNYISSPHNTTKAAGKSVPTCGIVSRGHICSGSRPTVNNYKSSLSPDITTRKICAAGSSSCSKYGGCSTSGRRCQATSSTGIFFHSLQNSLSL